MSSRDYDVLLYGATGFVGRQTVAYIARHATSRKLKWAIAGRSHDKLVEVHRQLGLSPEVEIFVADSRDQPAVDRMVACARVVLNTAGPFALYGDCVVDACVRFKSHYVDITGETPWVRSLIDRYHAQASAQGTRIVPCCGFDSVPSDLGTLLAVRGVQRLLGADCREATGYFQMDGGFNGGTIATVLQLHESGAAVAARDPFLLNPAEERPARHGRRMRDPKRAKWDSRIDAWVGPFFMSPINTRVVRRSAAVWQQRGEGYGSAFDYQEYLRFGKRWGYAKSKLFTAGQHLMQFGLRHRTSRRLLESVLPGPGSGPSQKRMDGGWFRLEVWACTADDRAVRVRMRHQGDPGNRATVRLVCESALCLVEDHERLPGGPESGGVLTPATAMGESLVARLKDSGFAIDGPEPVP